MRSKPSADDVVLETAEARHRHCLESLESEGQVVSQQIQALAAPLAAGPVPSAQVEQILNLLVQKLLPRFQAEEAVLLPAIDNALEKPGASAGLRAQHAKIRGLVELLGTFGNTSGPGGLHGGESAPFRRHLAALCELLSRHLDEEGRVCRQFCATLAPGQLAVLIPNLQKAEQCARQHIVLVALPRRESTEGFALRSNRRATTALVFTLADLDRLS